MNRTIRNVAGLVGVLAVISLLVITQQSGSQRAEAQTGAPPAVIPSSGGKAIFAHQPGVPGIQTSLGSDKTPAFTENDVREYFATHPTMYQRGPATITRIEFLSAKNASARLNQQIDRQDDAIVCIVTLKGTFVVSGPPSAAAVSGSVSRMIFDGRTGNLIGDLMKPDKILREPRP